LFSLTKLTSAELLRLNNNVDCLDEFISELPSIEASNKNIENTITKIMDLASKNTHIAPTYYGFEKKLLGI